MYKGSSGTVTLRDKPIFEKAHSQPTDSQTKNRRNIKDLQISDENARSIFVSSRESSPQNGRVNKLITKTSRNKHASN